MQNKPDREIVLPEEINSILCQGKYTTISMCRQNEPYIVTLSYGYDKDSHALYFHCAKQGLKLDFISENPMVCATVIEDGGYISDECAHAFKSVVFLGEMFIVERLEEKKHGMQILLNHLEEKASVKKEMILKSDNAYSRMNVLRLDIKQIHGKAGR